MDGNVPMMQIGGNDPDRLLALTPNRFVAPCTAWQFEFHRNANGAVHALTIDANNTKAYYVKDVRQAGNR